MAFRSSIELAVVLAIVSNSPSLHAAPAPAEASPKDRAAALLRRGVQLRREGNEQAAFESFERALELSPEPRTLAQLGLTAKSLRRYVEAEKMLVAALASSHDAWIAEHRAPLTQALDIVRTQLAWIELRSHLEVLQVRINGGAPLSVRAGEKLRVNAGRVHLEMSAHGHLGQSVALEVPAESVHRLSVDLVRRPAPRRTVLRPPASPPDPVRLPTYLAAGVGVAGLVAGTYFGVRTLSLKNDRNEVCPTSSCQTREGEHLDDRARRAATFSTVSFAVGAVGLGAGALLWLRPWRAPARAGATLHVIPYERGLGGTVSWKL